MLGPVIFPVSIVKFKTLAINSLLLGASSLVSLLLVLFSMKFIDKKLARPPVDLDAGHLVLAHDGQYTSGEIQKLRSEFSRPFRFKKVSWEEDLVNGDYVNKNSDGSRFTRGNEKCSDVPPRRRVWLFGGSTMYGYGVADENTIPSQLASYLEAETGGSWCVKNFGRGSYNSSLELDELVSLLVEGKNEKPGFVIFLDGLNDLNQPMHYQFVPRANQISFSERPSEIMVFLALKVQRTISPLLASLGLESPLKTPLRVSRVVPTDTPACEKEVSSGAPGIKVSDACAERLDKAVKKIFANWAMARRILGTYGIKFMPVLQPVPSYPLDDPRRNHELLGAGGYAKSGISLSGYAYDLHKKGQIGPGLYSSSEDTYLDASGLFSSRNKGGILRCNYYYVDPVHYTSCGSRIIANYLGEAVISSTVKS